MPPRTPWETAIEEPGETGGDGPDRTLPGPASPPRRRETGETIPMRPAVAENGSGSGNTAPKRPFIVRMRWTTGESNGLRAPFPTNNGLSSGPFPHIGKMRRNDECSQGRQPSEIPSGPTVRVANSSRKTAARRPRIGRNGSEATDVYAHANGLSSGPFPHVGKCGGTTSAHKEDSLRKSVRPHGTVANSFRKTAALQIRTHRTERGPGKRTDRPPRIRFRPLSGPRSSGAPQRKAPMRSFSADISPHRK